jgi:hypothetical protein
LLLNTEELFCAEQVLQDGVCDDKKKSWAGGETVGDFKHCHRVRASLLLPFRVWVRVMLEERTFSSFSGLWQNSWSVTVDEHTCMVAAAHVHLRGLLPPTARFRPTA